MVMRPDYYKSFVFDCDGVILDSNRIKTSAFYKTALKLGEKPAKSLVDYHVSNGGISRYKKFEWLLDTFSPGYSQATLDLLLNEYASEIRTLLLGCDIASGLREFKKITGDIPWYIVSGGDQEELRWVFKERKISELFEGGIFGSPDSKDVILSREIAAINLETPGLFIGDSQYDHEAASRANLDFVFVSNWTEFRNMLPYASQREIPVYKDIQQLAENHFGIKPR